jgi:cholesterol transport system auxiliary component
MRPAFIPLAAATLLTACAALQPPPEMPSTFVLEARRAATAQRPKRDLVLAVSMPRARPGFDSAQMAYVRRSHELEYFTKNRWADTPPRMLAPLLAEALDQSGGLRAVTLSPGAASADLRLDVEIVRLLQDFSTRPSRVRFTLRAQLVEVGTRRVLATRELDETENAPSDDAYGGVIATNRALERLLEQVLDFCVGQPVSR